MFSRMRHTALAFAVALSFLGCDSKTSTTEKPATRSKSATKRTAPLTDLTTASTLEPVRKAFNARKGEARFLTLLAPT